MFVLSNINDNNIFHIFYDILKYHNPQYKSVIINSSNLKLNNLCQKWRIFVLKKIYNTIIFRPYNSYQKSKIYNNYNYLKHIKYNVSPNILDLYQRINSKQTGNKYILLNQRDLGKRYLYDFNSKKKLEDYLLSKNLKLPIKTCNFGKLSPKEQYEICKDCAILICTHGAGCTNLIFTPQKTPLIEINLRKHWYCDPVCDNHFFGNISVNCKCNGKLNTSSSYHKADYHNLCYLINKKYIEIEAVEYSEGFTSRNPIDKKNIYIDGDNLVNIINSEI